MMMVMFMFYSCACRSFLTGLYSVYDRKLGIRDCGMLANILVLHTSIRRVYVIGNRSGIEFALFKDVFTRRGWATASRPQRPRAVRPANGLTGCSHTEPMITLICLKESRARGKSRRTTPKTKFISSTTADKTDAATQLKRKNKSMARRRRRRRRSRTDGGLGKTSCGGQTSLSKRWAKKLFC